ncbi:response regulator [Methylobacterium sp. SD274]|jgi:DNA-binding NtrC family response regulator|uniref:response regulator n=1 Tax=Methylobacterium sp. SD274 TaxID=2782009 RepID=UPI001A972AE8|nr:response regulator [Methylobacterium sp. SD274]MBO1019283.1 response regulator [Methylobacterium sp. SD274]
MNHTIHSTADTVSPAQIDGPVALVVEDDAAVRDLAAAILEETDLDVIACDSAEAAIGVLERKGMNVALLFADVRLGGAMDGIALARTVEQRWPDVRMVLTSGYDERSTGRLPEQAIYMQKPWRALDVLVEAEHASAAVGIA